MRASLVPWESAVSRIERGDWGSISRKWSKGILYFGVEPLRTRRTHGRAHGAAWGGLRRVAGRRAGGPRCAIFVRPGPDHRDAAGAGPRSHERRGSPLNRCARDATAIPGDNRWPCPRRLAPGSSTGTGAPSGCSFATRPDPAPGPGEVLVRTAAIGLNFADLFVRAGAYPRTPRAALRAGNGDLGNGRGRGRGRRGVSRRAARRRRAALRRSRGEGSRAAARVFALPDGVDLVEAAAMPVVFLTAWYARDAGGSRGGRPGRRDRGGGRRRDGAAAAARRARREDGRARRLGGQARALPGARRGGGRPLRRRRGADRPRLRRTRGRRDRCDRRPALPAAVAATRARRPVRLYGFAAASGERGVAQADGGAGAPRHGALLAVRVRPGLPDPDRLQPLASAGPTGELRGRPREAPRGMEGYGRIRPILGPRFAFERLPDAHRALAGRGTTGKVVVVLG